MLNTDAFPACLAILLSPADEGGFANDPQDPGGATNHGVTIGEWSHYVGHPVTVQDIKNLTPAMVAPLYRTDFWSALACDKMPAALALCVFDFGVNAGPHEAAVALQHIVGAMADGRIGNTTLKDIQQYAAAFGLNSLIDKYQAARAAFYHTRPGFPRFGGDWERRTAMITAAAKGMIK